MGVRFPSVFSKTFVGPLPAGSAETVVLVSPPLTLPLDFATVIILCSANITPGASTTSFTYNLRRGTTTAGTILTFAGGWTFPIIAGNPTGTLMHINDTPGAAAGVQYALTVQTNGATAAGAWNDGYITAFCL